ncbi:MAG: hypothetical protein CMP22_05730, partial [Rickettsiales bacterium]|nr:hypothetical protein [Rickettsiales bacterium]
ENKRKIEFLSWSQLSKIPEKRELIEGLFSEGSMVNLFGSPNSGKTFLTIDLALHLSLGKEWHGLKVKKTKVVYVELESGAGFSKRINAFMNFHNITELPNIHFFNKSLNLCKSEEDINAFIRALQTLENVGLIIIDTLSRALAGGNENSSDDMGMFVRNCDCIRQATGATILVVHHSGKDKSKGGRGHSLLNGAVDTEIEISKKNDIILVSQTKQRDFEIGKQIKFILHPINFSSGGKKKGSCVLIKCNDDKTINLSVSARKTLDLLQKSINNSCPREEINGGQFLVLKRSSFYEAFKKAQICKSDNLDSIRKSLVRNFEALEKQGYIRLEGEKIMLLDRGGQN